MSRTRTPDSGPSSVSATWMARVAVPTPWQLGQTPPSLHSAVFYPDIDEALMTSVPTMVGAKMVLSGQWRGKGVFNVEQLDPEPFLDELGRRGLPWHVKEM